MKLKSFRGPRPQPRGTDEVGCIEPHLESAQGQLLPFPGNLGFRGHRPGGCPRRDLRTANDLEQRPRLRSMQRSTTLEARPLLLAQEKAAQLHLSTGSLRKVERQSQTLAPTLIAASQIQIEVHGLSLIAQAALG